MLETTIKQLQLGHARADDTADQWERSTQFARATKRALTASLLPWGEPDRGSDSRTEASSSSGRGPTTAAQNSSVQHSTQSPQQLFSCRPEDAFPTQNSSGEAIIFTQLVPFCLYYMHYTTNSLELREDQLLP